jgi:hypothetical protein
MIVHIKKSLTTVIVCGVLACSGFAWAEYVPPPSGPYQSSVVITSKDTTEQNNEHIYRFPPADLNIQEDDTAPLSLESSDPPSGMSNNSSLPAQYLEYRSEPALNDAPRPDLRDYSPPAPYPNANAAGSPIIQQQGYSAPANPGQGRQGPWYDKPQGQAYNPYSGQSYYPYSNPYYYQEYRDSRYEDQYSPFGTMPSPWSMMRDNPFFSE